MIPRAGAFIVATGRDPSGPGTPASRRGPRLENCRVFPFTLARSRRGPFGAAAQPRETPPGAEHERRRTKNAYLEMARPVRSFALFLR